MITTAAHSQLNNRFIELNESCHEQINVDAAWCWKD
jgi:hypothetical protein